MEPHPVPDNSPPVPWLDSGFIRRVYRTSAVLVVLLAVLLWEARGPASAAGLVLGSGLSLAMLAGVEFMVRGLTEGRISLKRMMLGAFVKLIGAAAVLGLAFLGALQGWVSLLALAAGFGLPHLVIILKFAGQRLRAAMGQEAGR